MLNFLKPKLERNPSQETFDIEELKRKFKSIGSLNSSSSLPVPSNINNSKTYKLYVGGKQVRADTQSSRPIWSPARGEEKSEIYCLVADASRKDVRNAVEVAFSSFNRYSILKLNLLSGKSI